MERDPVSSEAIDAYLASILRGEGGGWPTAWGDHAIAEVVGDRTNFHGIEVLLTARPDELSGWPESIRKSVRSEAHMLAFWEESHRKMLVSFLDGLAQAGVMSLLMKGSALAYSLYSDPSARRRGDSDVLIKLSDLEATRRVLLGQGFIRRDDPHGLFFQETWLFDAGDGFIQAIDLHWQPSDSPALQTVLRVDEFFANSEPLPRLLPLSAMPSKVLTFLQGSLNQGWHGAKGYFVNGERVSGEGRLIWAWDNHLLARQFTATEWEELAEMAASRGVAPLCLAAIEQARQNFRTPVPDHVIQKLQNVEETDLANHLQETNRISSFFTDFAAIKTMGGKWHFFLGHALPDSRHLQRKYPNIANWPLPILHLRRIASVTVRWVTGR